jgi:hypothetical protein
MQNSNQDLVSFKKRELLKFMPIYSLIYDVLQGEKAVKDAGLEYLPNPSEKLPEAGDLRYSNYLHRAVFYNVTRRTLSAMVGQVFSVSPKIEVPELMNPFIQNCNGENVSFELEAKKLTEIVLAYGRGGVFIDFSSDSDESSVADVVSGKAKPIIRVYLPMDIWNWQTLRIGADTVLSLIVLAENFSDPSGFNFATKEKVRLRVLRLEDGQCTVEIFENQDFVINSEKLNFSSRRNFGSLTGFESLGKSKLKDSTGTPLSRIPFEIVGVENNNFDLDNPVFYDIASLNIAHYRNSADYEESCFILGQPTPVFSGLTKQWVDEVLKGEARFGSRGGVMLPVDATAQVLQASENTMIREAMDAKERQMSALGAKLVEQRAVQRTAFETKVDSASQSSTLINISKNVSKALENCLKTAYAYLASDSPGIEFSLNQDYDISKLSHEERVRALAEWQANAISFTELREVLRRAGVATIEDNEAILEIDTAAEKEISRQKKLNPKQNF